MSPSSYLKRLETGSAEVPPIDPSKLDGFVKTHFVDPALLRGDEFEKFMQARKNALLRRIRDATGQTGSEETDDLVHDGKADEAASEARLTIVET